VEVQQAALLIAIQAIDRVVEPLLGDDVGILRERIINIRRPAQLFEGRKNQLLILRRHAKFLDNDVANGEQACRFVEMRLASVSPMDSGHVHLSNNRFSSAIAFIPHRDVRLHSHRACRPPSSGNRAHQAPAL
jgi:hypothetical protein